MERITRVDPARFAFDVARDLTIAARELRPGPPQRMDGITLGVVAMDRNAPHGGEVHPDGDELLVVISGRVRVRGDSAPERPLELGPGEACIVRKGEWHQVDVLEPARLIHLTPGPNGDHRPLADGGS